jgi:hypothetical protein
MLTTGHFRIKSKLSGGWLMPSFGVEDEFSKDRRKAAIFKPDDRPFWESKADEFEIIPLTESEIMAQLPPEIAPRLPGFDW